MLDHKIEVKIDAAQRRITTRLLIVDDSVARPGRYADEGVYRPAVDIVTSHDKDRKRLTTYIHRILVGDMVVRWAMELRNEDPCPITDALAVAVGRYSESALLKRHDEVVTGFEELSELTRADVLEWATRAKD